MKRFDELNRRDQVYILSATSLKGMFKKAIKKECVLHADDDIYSTKTITTSDLQEMKSKEFIKHYSIDISENGEDIEVIIKFNDNSILKVKRELDFCY